MMWSAHRLAARRSDRSSASSEARNPTTSIALLSLLHACRRAWAPSPADSGSWMAGGGAAGGRASRRGLVRGWQGPDPGPDERVVGGEGLADPRVGRGVRDPERGLQQVPGLGGGNLPEGAAPAAVSAALQQRVHLGGD